MRRHSLPLALALLTTACGARSTLTEGTADGDVGPHQEHIYVSESDTWGTEARILRFDDMKGTNWTTFRPQVSYPCSVVVDDLNRIYFTTSTPPAVMRVDDMLGAGLESFSQPGSGAGQLAAPRSVALDAQGRIYVADTDAHRVVRMDDLSGAGWTAIGGPAAGSGVGEFNKPMGITVASDGKILVGDAENARVIQMDDINGAGWKELQISGANGVITSPRGVSYDAEGRIYVAEFESSILHRFDSIAGDGHVTYTSPSIVQLSHVFVHPSGRIYMGMLNGAGAVAAMDDISGKNFVTLGMFGAAEKQFRNPCGIYVR